MKLLSIFTACNETGKPGTDNPASENSPWEMRIRHQLEKHWQQEPANQGFVYDSIDLECYDLLQFVYKGSGNTAVWSDSGAWQPAAAGMMAGVGGDGESAKPSAKPLPVTVEGRYCKVLMSSHEFLFVR